MFARANGLCLNLNTVLVLLLVLRYTITLMRRMGFVKVLPLDNHIFLHKMTGLVIFCQAWFHTVMHLCNFCKGLDHACSEQTILNYIIYVFVFSHQHCAYAGEIPVLKPQEFGSEDD